MSPKWFPLIPRKEKPLLHCEKKVLCWNLKMHSSGCNTLLCQLVRNVVSLYIWFVKVGQKFLQRLILFKYSKTIIIFLSVQLCNSKTCKWIEFQVSYLYPFCHLYPPLPVWNMCYLHWRCIHCCGKKCANLTA